MGRLPRQFICATLMEEIVGMYYHKECGPEDTPSIRMVH